MSELRLSDGRRIAYEQFGDPDGYPIMLFHGNPGSRLAWDLMPGSPFMSGVRLIAPDRPGYGGTDFRRNAIESWPGDVGELADSLRIEKFALFAPSGGGPFALMCAWKIPDRISRVGIFGSVGPLVPEATEGALSSLRLLWKLSNPLNWLVRVQMWFMAQWARRNPESLALRVRDLELNDIDKAVFNRLQLEKMFAKEFPEAYRQNGIGSAYDTSLPGRWPIPLGDIRIPVQVWHAEQDNLVGNMPLYIADHIPNATLTVLRGVGHLWIVEHMAEVLSELVPQTCERALLRKPV